MKIKIIVSIIVLGVFPAFVHATPVQVFHQNFTHLELTSIPLTADLHCHPERSCH